jgi:putative transposase
MEVVPGVYHVFARGNNRRTLFLDDDDRLAYLRLLEDVTRYRHWRTMAYCLMGNHLHLLVETVEPNLGVGMHQLQGTFAQRFNRRYGTTGHVFERRFGGVVISTDEQLMTVATYIAHNPVEAGVCASAEQWRWGSHAAVAGAGAPPPWLAVDRLLWYYAALGGDPREAYLSQVRGRAAAVPAATVSGGARAMESIGEPSSGAQAA